MADERLAQGGRALRVQTRVETRTSAPTSSAPTCATTSGQSSADSSNRKRAVSLREADDAPAALGQVVVRRRQRDADHPLRDVAERRAGRGRYPFLFEEQPRQVAAGDARAAQIDHGVERPLRYRR